MKQQQQVGENLCELAIELNAQINEVKRLLEAVASLGATSRPGSTYDRGAKAKGAFTAEICKHPGFIWLFRQPEFKAAFEYFEQRIEEKKLTEWAIVLRKMEFLEAFAASGWLAFSESSWLPRKISRSEKDRAIAIATELMTFVRDGFGRPDYPVMQQLEGPLSRFVMQIGKGTKREYSGPTDRQKIISIRLALYLRDLDLKQREVVRLLESAFSIFDFDLGHRTAQNYVREGFER